MDINGKIANQPIHRLLGTCKESVPVYSSTAFHETKEQYAEEALILRIKDGLHIRFILMGTLLTI